jgi:CBS domain containing-hemolysin-like protein
MELLILFLLIVPNGVFAMSEMSIVAARKTRSRLLHAPDCAASVR